mgnify:CR=1 FL=1
MSSTTPTARDLFLEAIGTIGNLYPAPRTLGRALTLLRDPDSDVGDIAALIAQDPALAADVLRCANSAAYGVGLHVSAIDEAVQKIGSSETIRIVGRVITQSMTRHHLANYGIDAEDFWAESLFNGIFVEQLAEATGSLDRDEAYLCGLMRFIGRLAINQTIHAFGAGLFWDGHEPLSAWEQHNVGVSYAEAGGLLLRRWQLPEAVSLAVEGQDLLESAESTVPLVQALHFTSTVLPPGLDLAFFLAVSDRPVAVPRQDPFVRAHGLSQDSIAELLATSQEKFSAIRDEHYH